MRKITGYIGAIIIVFALMGSILMGYALNVNGNTAIINDYEKVTDVSGLYSHTQEPTYIEYNPASNYIGYNIEQSGSFTITNTTSANYGLSYGLYKNNGPNCAWNASEHASGAFYNGGSVVHYSTSANQAGTNDNYFIINGDNIRGFINVPSSNNKTCIIDVINGGVVSTYYSSNLTISYNNGTVIINLLDTSQTITKSTGWLIVPKNNGDYVPVCGGNVGYYQYNDVYPLTGIPPITNAVNTWGGEPVYNLYSTTYPGTNFWVFVPKTFNYQPVKDTGINYSDSNRVNNYLMETTYTGGTTSVTTRTLNLSPGMGLTDYARAMEHGQVTRYWRVNQYPYDYNGTNTYIGMPTYTAQNTSSYADNIRTYKLTDILNYYSITSDKPITVSCYGTTQYSLSNGEVIGDNNFVKMTGDWPYGSAGYLTNKWYCIYDPNTGIYDYYNSNGVKMQTRYDCYVSFCGSIPRYGPMINGSAQIVGYYDFGTRTTPYLNITYETETGGTTTYHYADITKGFSIKDENTVNTIWDNGYLNGNIQILFRADYPTSNYHNDIIVGDNNISVDYTDGGYYITLNSGDPVNIGKWRNIVLDIDLRNGELTAIPVRTFNSFSNVVLDVTNIKIGNLVNATPTNIIEWAPTSNSLMFNVYSTSVFMDTYGVVMVDPTLNITEYFTDLDNFYKLRLYNFSIIGDSVTINGVNADVIGENITINEQTIRIKEMAITYVDNHVYISDSNVNIDLGEITDNIVSMAGNWYFETELLKGFTTTKIVYNWNWEDFILDNTQFCIMYMGIALIALMIARHYCTLSLTDYIVLILSFAIALTVQVIA